MCAKIPFICVCPEPHKSYPRPQFHFFKIRFKFKSPYRTRFSKNVPFLQSSQPKSCICISVLPHACHILLPSHRPRFGYPSSIRWDVTIKKFLIEQLSPAFSSVFRCFEKNCEKRLLALSFLSVRQHETNHLSNIYIYIYKEPTWCNLAVCLLLTEIILYMFRTLFASILRST
jgi:hypothetical protein